MVDEVLASTLQLSYMPSTPISVLYTLPALGYPVTM